MAPLDGIDVVILAGGLGTRLAPVLPDRQKVVAEVAGRPFLDRVVAQVAGAGAGRVVLALGHRSGDVERAVDAGRWPGLDVVASVEPRPLGTGGALRLALGLARTGTLCVLNGDSIADVDFARLVAVHRGKGARVTMALVRVADAARYGRAVVGADGAVTAFAEKGGGGPGEVNAGVYLVERSVAAAIPAGRAVSLEREVFPGLIGGGLYGVVGDGPFVDIGTPESLAAAGPVIAAWDESTGAR